LRVQPAQAFAELANCWAGNTDAKHLHLCSILFFAPFLHWLQVVLLLLLAAMKVTSSATTKQHQCSCSLSSFACSTPAAATSSHSTTLAAVPAAAAAVVWSFLRQLIQQRPTV
jgi:hypothetical protein